MDASSLSIIQDSKEEFRAAIVAGNQTLNLLSDDDEEQSEFNQLRSSHAANFNDILTKMQALSMHLSSCEEPLPAESLP